MEIRFVLIAAAVVDIDIDARNPRKPADTDVYPPPRTKLKTVPQTRV